MRLLPLVSMEASWATRIDDTLGSMAHELRLVEASSEISHLDIAVYRAGVHDRIESEDQLRKKVETTPSRSRQYMLLMAVGDADPQVTAEDVAYLLDAQAIGYDGRGTYLRAADIDEMADSLEHVIKAKLALLGEDSYDEGPGLAPLESNARDLV